jgi:FG-GAP-like repeat
MTFASRRSFVSSFVAIALGATAQASSPLPTVTGRFIMSFFACTPGSCLPTQDTIYLAQSNDGVNWSLVPGYPTQNGSVPTPVRRGDTLYVYYVNPIGSTVSVQKFHYSSGTWDAPVQITLNDPIGYGSLVDPTAIIDANGKINLAYTSALANVNYEAGGCPPGQTTCVQHFRLATEDSASDGTSFTSSGPDLVSVPLGGAGQPDHAADPSLFQAGTQFVLTLSLATLSGNSPNSVVTLYTAPSLSGPYTLSSTLPNGVLIPNPAGVGSGYFNNQLQQYWTYVQAAGGLGPLTVISRAVKTSLSQQIQISDLTQVMSSTSLGIGSNISLQHPHIAPLVAIAAQAHDYNADGFSDIAWRDSSGNTAVWLMTGAQVLSAAGFGTVPLTWTLVGQRDFDGDGKADLLWRNTSGDTVIWFMNGTSLASASSIGNIPSSWTVVATGDFNGDGYGDILWQDNAGNLAVWLMKGATVTSAGGLGNVPSIWSIVGAGDFNRDGKTDLLWRDTGGNTAIWLMNGAIAQSTAGYGAIPLSWLVAATGDYNGDGDSDLLWRDSSGNTAIWFMNGTTIASTGNLGTIPTAWTVQSTNAE